MDDRRAETTSSCRVPIDFLLNAQDDKRLGAPTEHPQSRVDSCLSPPGPGSVCHQELSAKYSPPASSATEKPANERPDANSYAQNEKLPELKALRAHIDGLNAPTPTRSGAAVAAETDKPQPPEKRRQADKDKNCVRISTQRSLAESLDAEDNKITFGSYIPSSKSGPKHKWRI
ncbi:hypothetical protein IFM5058_08084 [Aspergillus udagawae]|nr:hypothetical protein IFM5058_08084 [Aspergillus udagawae]